MKRFKKKTSVLLFSCFLVTQLESGSTLRVLIYNNSEDILVSPHLPINKLKHFYYVLAKAVRKLQRPTVVLRNYCISSVCLWESHPVFSNLHTFVELAGNQRWLNFHPSCKAGYHTNPLQIIKQGVLDGIAINMIMSCNCSPFSVESGETKEMRNR